MLHQKELVLNKQDTKNMLKMLQIVRNTQILQVKNKLANLNSEINNLSKNQNINTTNKDNLTQTVEITANFPNVNSKQDIEEALSDLVNKATQFALKFKKN